MKLEFSKKLLIVDYILFILLWISAVIFTTVDFTIIITTWIAQIGISSTAYYWKAKNENRIKIPMRIIDSLSEEEKETIDYNEIIISLISSSSE